MLLVFNSIRLAMGLAQNLSMTCEGHFLSMVTPSGETETLDRMKFPVDTDKQQPVDSYTLCFVYFHDPSLVEDLTEPERATTRGRRTPGD